MIPSPREKWVIDRLKKQGYQMGHTYSDDEVFLWRPTEPWRSFDWAGTLFVFINRKKGFWLHIRPHHRPQMHVDYHLPWPTKKSWHLLEEAELILIEENKRS